jgi:superfamily II DNA/RNA helicase
MGWAEKWRQRRVHSNASVSTNSVICSEFCPNITRARWACNHPWLFDAGEETTNEKGEVFFRFTAKARADWQQQLENIPMEDWYPPGDIDEKDKYGKDKKPRLYGVSSKLAEYDRIRQDWQQNHPNEASIVFTDHKGTVDLIAEHFMRSNVNFFIFEGNMSHRARMDVLEAFRVSPGGTVLIATYAAEVALNITRASMVVTFETCFTPAKAKQAAKRAHRKGQLLEVTWFRLVCDNVAVERHIMRIVAQKLELEKNYCDQYSSRDAPEPEAQKFIDYPTWVQNQPLTILEDAPANQPNVELEAYEKDKDQYEALEFERIYVRTGRMLPETQVEELFEKSILIDDLNNDTVVRVTRVTQVRMRRIKAVRKSRTTGHAEPTADDPSATIIADEDETTATQAVLTPHKSDAELFGMSDLDVEAAMASTIFPSHLPLDTSNLSYSGRD